MLSPSLGLMQRETRSEWVRLRTLIYLRWMAIGGQLAAIVVATALYGFRLPLGLCYLAIGASVIANLISIFLFPRNKRMTEAEALLMLLFDLSQLSFLLFLTGGLTNPFALLILAPVVISASAMELRTTMVLGVLAILFVTLFAFVNVPLVREDGTLLEVPPVFGFGFWLAIVIGIVFLSFYARRIAVEIRSMSDALLATQMALSREQKLTDLGGVVAAAAHELGTPLATIKMVATELVDDLDGDAREDALLIRDQADRCRDILRSMGRAGKDDTHLRQAPLAAVLKEAAEPHLGRGKDVVIALEPGPGGEARQPTVLRRPEVIHGLRNLVQNAVDFAHGRVWVDGSWTDRSVTVRIVDDGEGYPAHVIGRIGDPFVRSRRTSQDLAKRPEYEGMGLGLFIAKTLLERTGAELVFANGSDPFLAPNERPDRGGAIVEVVWPREVIEADTAPVAQNTPITA